MALDVHVIDSETAQPKGWPECEFKEPIHSSIFFGGAIEIGRYPFLRRMQDYYADATYSGRDLADLLRELEEVVPKFAEHMEVYQVLDRFAKVCKDAKSRNKVVLCLCD